MKEEQEPKKRGGYRENSGRKPKGITQKLTYTWRVSRDVWDILEAQDLYTKTDFIENAIRAYARYHDIKIPKRDGE